MLGESEIVHLKVYDGVKKLSFEEDTRLLGQEQGQVKSETVERSWLDISELAEKRVVVFAKNGPPGR